MGDKKKRVSPAHPEVAFDTMKLAQVASVQVIQNSLELIDHEWMVKRLKDGAEISCAFVSPSGYVHTSVSARKYSLQDLCTCDATYFCRHAAALVQTFQAKPETFLDLEKYLDGLEGLEKAQLVDMLRQMVGRYPGSALEVLAMPGFVPAEVLDDPADDDHLFDQFSDEFDLLDDDSWDEEDFEPEDESEEPEPGHMN